MIMDKIRILSVDISTPKMTASFIGQHMTMDLPDTMTGPAMGRNSCSLDTVPLTTSLM
jgi:hypothetical protein